MRFKNDIKKENILVRKMEKSFIKEPCSILANAERFAFHFLVLGYSAVYLLLFFLFCYEFQVLFLKLLRQSSYNPFIFEQIQCLCSGVWVPMLRIYVPVETSSDEFDEFLVSRVLKSI